MIRNALASFRYNVSAPIYYMTVISVVVLVMFCVVILVFQFKESSFIKGAVDQVEAVSKAVKWQYRAVRYDGFDKAGIEAPHTRTPGTIEGMTKEGKLVVRFPSSGRFENRAFELADMIINDVEMAAQYVNGFRLQPINIDIYSAESCDVVVIWMQTGKPLNLLLMEHGVATPVETPPTNIVNLLMAAYYWNAL